MKPSPKRNITIDADYAPPDKHTPEDDLSQRLFAPPPLEPIPTPIDYTSLALGVTYVMLSVAVFVLFTTH
jgi:hypothetical protein